MRNIGRKTGLEFDPAQFKSKGPGGLAADAQNPAPGELGPPGSGPESAQNLTGSGPKSTENLPDPGRDRPNTSLDPAAPESAQNPPDPGRNLPNTTDPIRKLSVRTLPQDPKGGGPKTKLKIVLSTARSV